MRRDRDSYDDDYDYTDYDLGVGEPPPPDYSTYSQENLFKAMSSAYAAQAYIVDNQGSDDSAYFAELKCEAIEAEINKRNLYTEYTTWADNKDKENVS